MSYNSWPLGSKQTIEEQVTGTANYGGIQLCLVDPKQKEYLQYLERKYPHAPPRQPQGPLFQIYVKSIAGQVYPLQVTAHQTVYELKRQLSINGYPIASQNLLFCGKPLQQFHTLSDYNITPESTLILVLNLRGGGHV